MVLARDLFASYETSFSAIASGVMTKETLVLTLLQNTKDV